MKEALDIVQIRPAVDGDAQTIADLHGRSFLATYMHLPRTVEATENGASQRLAIWTSRLQDPRAGCEVFVAGDNSRILGFVYVGPTADIDDVSGRTGQVFSIHVDPAELGTGIGSKLLDYVVDYLRSSGFEDATLWVVAGNRRAREFYEARGWKPDGMQRKEILALENGDGDEVGVIRYRRELKGGADI